MDQCASDSVTLAAARRKHGTPTDPGPDMKSPRLKGAAARAVARLARTPAGASLLRRQGSASYRLGELLALPPEARLTVPEHATPLAGAPPRQWSDADLGAPDAPEGRWSGRQLVRAYRSGDLRPSEVIARLLAHVDEGHFGNATFSPFVAVDRSRAVDAAREADARYANGPGRGCFDGVPVPVKDEHDMIGLPTRGGTAYLDRVADADSFCVHRLRGAGALVYGKTHTTEWGMNPCGINPHFSMPRCVYGADNAAGGSSTGSGAAVALGLAPVAAGSDGGGSIRIPSACQGIVGLKPTFARVGRTGDIYGSGTVGVIGPLGQSVTDLVDFMMVAAGDPDPNDYATHLSGAAPPLASWESALGRGVRGCRIGIPRGEWEAADAGVAAACRTALDALEREGAVLVDVDIPWIDFAQAIGVLCIGPESMANLTDDQARFGDQFGVELTVQTAILGGMTTRDVLVAQRTRHALRVAVAEAMSRVDVLALPTLPSLPPDYPVGDDRVEILDDDATMRMCRYTFLANILGLPAGSVPVGLVEGLPVGFQIVGDAWDEASVLAVMAHLQRVGVTTMPPVRGAWSPFDA